MSNLTQERGEVAAFSASMLRRIIEGWKTADYEEIGMDKASVEEKLGLECLSPLSELDTGMDRRRRCSEERLENSWGEDWQVNLGTLLPKWPSETFLRELAVFSEKNTWEESKVFFPAQVKARLSRPRSRKSPWLTSRDLVKEGEDPTWDCGAANKNRDIHMPNWTLPMNINVIAKAQQALQSTIPILEGLFALDRKIEAPYTAEYFKQQLRMWVTPTKRKEVQAFLRFGNY